jgi:hypothetical protein
MAERFAPLRAARPTIRVEKLAFFCNPATGGTFSSSAIEIMNKLKFAVAKAKVFPHLEAWVRVGREITRM